MHEYVERVKKLQVRASNITHQFLSTKKALDDLYDMRKFKIEEQERLKKDEETLQRTMSLFKNLSERENEKSKNLFVSLVNYGLHAVFGENVSFDLEQKIYQTGVFYSPVLIKDGKQEDLMSSGGGILDIVSFLCRIVVLVSFYTKESRVLRLDEPFKNLSREYWDAATRLISELSDQFHIQIIMVTHLAFLRDIPGAKVFQTSKDSQGHTVYELSTNKE